MKPGLALQDVCVAGGGGGGGRMSGRGASFPTITKHIRLDVVYIYKTKYFDVNV